ncbi:hypothetical protein E2C01_055824 [Portunus trituberculatus]|uniref:Uncharacterized protein n=1 Tax=Portunus trituberculatus TaxID=210409 RepID=A0A5B7GW33_PORTR|nr:hypothetical protein [Portunus trituberculatus]
MESTLEGIDKENKALKEKCKKYEAALEGLRVKVEAGEEGMSEEKLDEWKKAWKEDQEDKKVKMRNKI